MIKPDDVVYYIHENSLHGPYNLKDYPVSQMAIKDGTAKDWIGWYCTSPYGHIGLEECVFCGFRHRRPDS